MFGSFLDVHAVLNFIFELKRDMCHIFDQAFIDDSFVRVTIGLDDLVVL